MDPLCRILCPVVNDSPGSLGSSTFVCFRCRIVIRFRFCLWWWLFYLIYFSVWNFVVHRWRIISDSSKSLFKNCVGHSSRHWIQESRRTLWLLTDVVHFHVMKIMEDSFQSSRSFSFILFSVALCVRNVQVENQRPRPSPFHRNWSHCWIFSLQSQDSASQRGRGGRV